MPLPTLNDTKHFLRVDHSEDDALIASLLITSKTLVEEIIRDDLDNFDIVPEPINQEVLILTATLYEERQISKSDKTGITLNEALIDIKLMLYPYRKDKF